MLVNTEYLAMQASDQSTTRYLLSQTKKYLGIEANTTSTAEKVISAVGALIGILLCQIVTLQYFSPSESLLLITSMGATATLVFALPHGALSQPWSVFGGHLISALIGILSYQYIADTLFASAIAVGGAVLIMYFLRCLHPPGGATALFCVQGGEKVHELGFNFMVEPLLLNIVVMLGVAIIFNGLFSWRRYPAHVNFRHVNNNSVTQLSHEDVSAALLQLDSFVDVSTEELAVIFDKALTHAKLHNPQQKVSLKLGGFYSNGLLGEKWNIKKVTHIEGTKVTMKIVAGKEQGIIKQLSQSAFYQWATFEVECLQGNWIKIKTA